MAGKETVVCRCYARVGLLGNPSDGFFGKTISFSLANFHAEVRVEPQPDRVELVPNPLYDRHDYADLMDLRDMTLRNGYYGGLRILRAACKRFVDLCVDAGIAERIRSSGGFRMHYSTTVPMQVGMAGSSAIVTAALKALMRFYRLRLADVGLTHETLPNVILSVEKGELGIAAGLQDRVIQVYEGVVHMDFDKEHMDAHGHGRYTPLDAALLPPLYVGNVRTSAGESGKAHSDVRARWEAGDSVVRDAMRQFASFAEQGRQALEAGDVDGLCKLMDSNFALRRRIYGDAVIGEVSLRMIEMARRHGFSAKFTGSGGAIVCLRREPVSEEEAGRIRDEFRAQGFDFARAEINHAHDPFE